MARYTGPKEKIERRFTEKLFLKGERSYSPKAATVRKPYPPGMHGKKLKNRKFSEYGLQLLSKQKVRAIYRILEKQFRKYIEEALKSKSDNSKTLVELLERRLDNVVFRMGFSDARDRARRIRSIDEQSRQAAVMGDQLACDLNGAVLAVAVSQQYRQQFAVR